MQRMRDVLRGALGRSLEGLSEFDRLGAAWPVACGPALAVRGRLLGYDSGAVQVEVDDRAWLEEFERMRAVLERELARIARVPVTAIHFNRRSASR